MEQKQFSYTIGDKTYTQRQLVLGQILLLAQLLKHVAVMKDLSPQAMITTIGLQMPAALAIVLIPEGTKVIDKADEAKRAKLAEELSFSSDADTAFQVVGDFFDCNPIASLLEKLSGVTGKIAGQMKTLKQTESKPSFLSSAEETSLKETPCSGASQPESVSHT